ncbi:MAG: biopolymer transport protein ExbB [Pirellulaceae bacterium]|jgi:biopolymer transport protein ExbB
MNSTSAVIRLLAVLGLVVAFAAFALQHATTMAQENAPIENAAQPEGGNAQAAPQATEDNPENGSSIQSVGTLIFKPPKTGSDWVAMVFYIVLAIFSVYAATVTFERFINLKKEKFIPSSFSKRLQTLISTGQDDKQSLESLAQATNTPVGRILRAGLTRAGRPLPEVEKSMEDAAMREIQDARSRIRPLKTIASTAPLVGLLGTVVGIMFAFQVSSQQGLGKGQMLAEGIYLALLTTAGGLTIAIPCLLLVAFFNGKLDRFFRLIDESLLDVIPCFTKLESSNQQWPATQQPVAAETSSKEPITASTS